MILIFPTSVPDVMPLLVHKLPFSFAKSPCPPPYFCQTYEVFRLIVRYIFSILKRLSAYGLSLSTQGLLLNGIIPSLYRISSIISLFIGVSLSKCNNRVESFYCSLSQRMLYIMQVQNLPLL